MRKSTDIRISASPRGLFLVLVVSNALLSYGNLGLQAKLWVGLFGVALPFAFVLLDRSGSWRRALQPPKKDIFVPPAWAWAAVLVLAVFVRLFRLTTLSAWPLLDESTMAYLGVEAARGVPFPWYFEMNQMPTLFNRGLGLLFRWMGPSLATLWLYPALLSIATVLVVWRSALLFEDRVLGFLFTTWWALSFPMVYTGRFCHPQSVSLLLSALVLYLWLRWRRSGGAAARAWACALGLAVGLGFQVYATWVVMAVAVVAAFQSGFGGKRPGRGPAAAFWIPLIALVLPTALYMAGNSSPYLEGIASHEGWGHLSRWKEAFSYLAVLFWGVETPLFAYKPFWGGYLNPLATAGFLLGVVAWGCSNRRRLAAAALFILFMFPGLSTIHVEFLRVVHVFPLLVFGAAFGFRRLLTPFNRRSFFAALLLLALSFGLDFHHLAGRYAAFWPANLGRWHAYMKNPENSRANGLIRERAAKEGAGYIFTDFLQDPVDRTLWFATLPYNALEGAADPGVALRWAALVVNVHLAPFLEKRFPGSTWTWLSEGLDSGNGGLALVFLPLSGPVPVPLERWVKAHRTFSAVAARLIHSTYIKAPETPMLEILQRDRASFEGDPFLESVYWNRLMLSWTVEGRLDEALKAATNAVERGYPAAVFYNEAGCLRTLRGDLEGARRAFRQALECPFNRSQAAQNLERLR